MQKIFLVFTIFLCATSVTIAAEKKSVPEPQLSPRYQVIPTEYTYLNLNGDNTRKAVLKIDTFTGKTWILKDDTYKTSEGKIIVNRGWEELEIYLQTDDPRKQY